MPKDIKNFIKCIVGRGVLTPPPLLPTNLLQLFRNPPPSLLPITSIPTVLSVVLFLWLNGWLHHIWCAVLLNDIMDLHELSLGTFVPEGFWCILCNKASSLLRSSHNVVLCWYSDLILHTHTHKYTNTHTQRYIAHSGASRLHTLRNIYLHHCYVLTAPIFSTLNE